MVRDVKVKWYQQWLDEAKVNVEHLKMSTEHMQHECDVTQKEITKLGISKLVENVFIEMQRTTKVHQEVVSNMGLYHQAVSMDQWKGTHFLD